MHQLNLPAAPRLLTPMGWTVFAVLLLVLSVLAPVLNVMLPVAHPLHLSDFVVSLVGKIMCFAICALAMDLIWGYTGILSLGHGLFFALGGHVPDATNWLGWQLQVRVARFHGVSGLENTALALGRQ